MTTDERTIYGYTTYSCAVNWLSPNTIRCNNICEVDNTVYDNMRFNNSDEEENYRDIFQWFLTSLSESDVEWLEDKFGLEFTFSELLNVYVLCVLHYGTSWHGVACPVYDKDIWDRIKGTEDEYSDVN